MNWSQMYKENRYEDVRQAWLAVKQGEQSELLNEWDNLNIMNSLYKLKQYQECLELYKKHHCRFPTDDKLNNKMGWSVYFLYIKDFNFEKGNCDKYRNQVDYVLKCCPVDRYSPAEVIVFNYVRAVLENKLGTPPDYSRAMRYLDLLQVEELSAEERILEVQDGSKKHLASNREKWFMMKTKLLYFMHDYSECIKYCHQAFQIGLRFHSNSDNWLRRRAALCFMEMKEPAKARQELEPALSGTVRNWCFFQTACEIAMAENDEEKALKYAGTAALLDKSHDKRLKFYKKLADFLDRHGNSRMAMLHRQLISLLRQENKWNEKRTVEIPAEIAVLGKQDVLQELSEFWKTERDKGMKFYDGIVKKILPSGKDGFILCSDGSSYYFKARSIEQGRKYLAEGISVRFALEKCRNNKKNNLEDHAVKIKIVQEN